MFLSLALALFFDFLLSNTQFYCTVKTSTIALSLSLDFLFHWFIHSRLEFPFAFSIARSTQSMCIWNVRKILNKLFPTKRTILLKHNFVFWSNKNATKFSFFSFHTFWYCQWEWVTEHHSRLNEVLLTLKNPLEFEDLSNHCHSTKYSSNRINNEQRFIFWSLSWEKKEEKFTRDQLVPMKILIFFVKYDKCTKIFCILLIFLTSFHQKNPSGATVPLLISSFYAAFVTNEKTNRKCFVTLSINE